MGGEHPLWRVMVISFDLESSMPPQPLSLVRSNALVYLYPRPFEEIPHLCLLAAKAIAESVEIEAASGRLFVTMLGSRAKPAMAMLQAMTSTATIRAASGAVATGELTQIELDLYEIIMRRVGVATRCRNRFAHDCWGYTPDVPDGLLFLEMPERLDVYMALELKQHISERQKSLNLDHSITFDNAKVWIYREKDLQDAINELEKCRKYIDNLMICIWSRRRISLGDPQYTWLERAPEIRDELDRLRERRKTTPSARPPRRHRGRTEN